MIQDIAPKHLDNTRKPRLPEPDDTVFDYDGRNLFLKPDQTFFHVRDLSEDTVYQYLFSIGEEGFFAADLTKQKVISLDTRICRTYQPRYLGFACILGWQLVSWMRANQYCGRCGTKMEPSRTERALVCPSCGQIVYPRLNPAVIVGILNEKNQLLITRYAHGTYSKDALVAGYCEFGETVEETVLREVKEETGLDVYDLQYYKSQPWPFSSSLLCGFWCKADSHQPIKVQEEELRYAEWRNRTDVFDALDDSSLTAEMIGLFRNGKKEY